MKNLYLKMFNVMSEMKSITADMTVGKGKNEYKAVSEAEILNKAKPLFEKYKLIIFPISGEAKDNVFEYNSTDYNGAAVKKLRAMTELKVTYRIVDTESLEHQDVVGFGNGSDPQDKGVGKAFTYSFKNALAKTFMMFTGEDSDNHPSEDAEEDKKEKPAADKKKSPAPKKKFEKSEVTWKSDEHKKRATIIWSTMTKKHKMSTDEYKNWLAEFITIIPSNYGPDWTEENLAFLEKQVELYDPKLPF